jgi:hypothetical protein
MFFAVRKRAPCGVWERRRSNVSGPDHSFPAGSDWLRACLVVNRGLMAHTERVHELRSEVPSAEELNARRVEGWRLAAVVWERDVREAEQAGRHVYEVVPFGLRVADDCMHLVEDPHEREVILAALELIVQDYPLSKVAAELNRRGYRTREHSLWNAATVFELLPRLIDTGPRVFSSAEWAERRQRLFNVLQQ